MQDGTSDVRERDYDSGYVSHVTELPKFKGGICG